VGGYTMRSRRCRQVNLEELNLQFKHVDLMLECDNTIILVEETRRSKLEDLEKIDNTVEWLRRSRAQSNLKIIALVHHGRSADVNLVKALNARMSSRRRRKKQTVIYYVAKCEEGLSNKLLKYNIKPL
jgi:nickel-dependent lactate racemase